MRLHLNKKGIRILGVAESFRPDRKWSTLAGVVMRGDFIVDGLGIGRTSVGGDDATSSIASLWRRFRRNDINLLMVSGCILSLYNILDVDGLAKRTRTPVICLTYKETGGIEDSIIRHFPGHASQKLAAYRKLGKRKRVLLESGHTVFVRTNGISDQQTTKVLNMFTLQGSIPEPVRLARLLARAGPPARRS
jgi:endonuclease V-like protein UPF0215 family